MPQEDDYHPPPSSGLLRLKGTKDGAITKKKTKKKKPKPPSSPATLPETSTSTPAQPTDAPTNAPTPPKERGVHPLQDTNADAIGEEATHVSKTAAERRHEEKRRKRVRFFPSCKLDDGGAVRRVSEGREC